MRNENNAGRCIETRDMPKRINAGRCDAVFREFYGNGNVKGEGIMEDSMTVSADGYNLQVFRDEYAGKSARVG